MEFKALLFAGVALFFAVVFFSVGGFLYYHFNSQVDFYEDKVWEYEDPEGKNHHWYEADWPEGSGVNHTWPDYVNATQDLEKAKDNRSFTTIMFVLGAIALLVAIALVAIHFILEKRADDKMAASFFVDDGTGSGGKPPAR